MLEDESGRLRLTGSFLTSCLLVTGCIVAVMGTENSNGDFEVIDLKIPELAPQPTRWERGESNTASKKKVPKKEKTGKIAIVSTLGVSGDDGDTMSLDLLTEYLLGESTTPTEQEQAASISRLIIAGNSLASANPIPSRDEAPAKRPSGVKKYGYDASAYNPAPTDQLDLLLSNILPSLPITLIPGEQDPTHTSLPQQPMHPALFPQSRLYMAAPDSEDHGWLDTVTNPWEGDIDGWRVLATGGQPIDDVYKYVEGDDRLQMIEATLRWRLCAPTAPDTLCKPSSTIWHSSSADNTQGATPIRIKTVSFLTPALMSTSWVISLVLSPQSSMDPMVRVFDSSPCHDSKTLASFYCLTARL